MIETGEGPTGVAEGVAVVVASANGTGRGGNAIDRVAMFVGGGCGVGVDVGVGTRGALPQAATSREVIMIHGMRCFIIPKGEL